MVKNEVKPKRVEDLHHRIGGIGEDHLHAGTLAFRQDGWTRVPTPVDDTYVRPLRSKMRRVGTGLRANTLRNAVEASRLLWVSRCPQTATAREVDRPVSEDANRGETRSLPSSSHVSPAGDLPSRDGRFRSSGRLPGSATIRSSPKHRPTRFRRKLEPRLPVPPREGSGRRARESGHFQPFPERVSFPRQYRSCRCPG